ncbi:hypothetical protein QVD17_38453 [Tagetes erecta]|uniref:U-box domain-containing protein n=1 Tax=Tagetes erecta TaxID=13708 RepID=A0AAD8N9C6_TARER|nr:hypothetical protein QVD17_38453 [Tagetes erecta]
MSREKINELYLNVPTFFKCPISMDVMKSPVSLCTGVTYDRTSIQKWLDSGHNTCPATMQVLHSTDVVPNLTLRRLIRVWSDSYLLRPQSHASFNNHFLFDSLKKLIMFTEDDDDVTERVSVGMLTSIVEFAKVCGENREALASLQGFVPLMMKMMRKSRNEIQVIELVVVVLDLVLLEKQVIKQLIKLITDDSVHVFDTIQSSFSLVLQQGGLEARTSAARVLETLSSLDNEFRRMISQSVLLKHLYHLTANSDPTDGSTDRSVGSALAVDAGLSALIAVSTSRQTKKDLIRYGIVTTCGKILSGRETSVKVIEKVMKLLELMSTCTEGRTAISEDENCVQEIVKRLMKVSTQANEYGIGVIWSLCYMSRDRNAQQAAMKSNGLTKVLLVMQSNCSGIVRQMCSELVKVFRVNSKSCLASYETRMSHIMPY